VRSSAAIAIRIASEYDAATSGEARTFMEHMRRSSILTVAAAALALSGGAAHAATWSAPQTLSTPHTFAGPLSVATRGDGGVVAAWPWQDDVGGDAVGGWSTAARAQAASSFGIERPTVDGLVALGPFAQKQSIAVGTQAVPGTRGPGGGFLSRIRASVSRGTARSPATAATWRLPVLGSAANGSTALIAYVEMTRTSSGAIRRIVRTIDRRNGAWSSPSTISGRGHADAIAAAVGARGDAVVVFVRDGKLLARLRRPGHNWGSIQTLTTSPGATTWTLGAAIDGRGQVRVVWRRHPYRGVTELRTAAVLVGRNTFTAPQTLVANGASADFAIVPAAPGWAIAGVVTPPGQAPRPVLHRTTGGSRFTPGLEAAPAQGGIRGADVVTNRGDASITVAWVQPIAGQSSDGIIRAATVPSTTAPAFGPVEDVSPPEAAHEVRLVPGPTGPTALWTARPEGTGPSIPIGQIHTVVRAASRTG
jgi:hypothetical protein